MLGEHWDEAAELFERGKRLGAGERRALLTGAPAELARLVQGLWENQDKAGGFLAAEEGEESLRPTEEYAPPAMVEGNRFPAGTVLGGRYRILDLIGRGGMGEVYKAYDQILNQHVALKFLPLEASHNRAALSRLRNEVRVARQVSHPNVCRVYDIGIEEELHYVCMEYVDGENLASLLLRIGHLPQEKAIDISRRICAGLAAAHERGVLHRDLKPANIMIDSRGRVRITDFGIAVLADELSVEDLRSGTPSYMAPEQMAGKECTVRSDIYSLGLVFSELFTGKLHPSEYGGEIDPAIERLIERCIDPEPSRRPPSALAVALDLPGGDPVAAALAAGETPSPEMVAASGTREGFRTSVAVCLFLFVAAGMFATGRLAGRASIVGRAPIELSPEVLEFKAQEMLKQFGYQGLPRGDSAFGFVYSNRGYPAYAKRTEPANYRERLAAEQPSVISFFYRQSPESLVSTLILAPGGIPGGLVTDSFPANVDPGGVVLKLDGKGRLVSLEVRPPDSPSPPPGQPEFDWNQLFLAAGLDSRLFAPAPASHTPQWPYDAWKAWDGVFEPGRPEAIRVEAATFRGRPVQFGIYGPWPEVPDLEFPQPHGQSETPAQQIRFVVLLLSGCGLLIGAVVLAKRNLALSRGDRRGAARLGRLMFGLTLASGLLIGHHVANYNELMNLTLSVSWASFVGLFVHVLYLATEPHVRKNWPNALVSWSRLLNGQFFDPLVGSHVLLGIAAGMLLSVLRLAPVAAGYGEPFYPLLHAFESPAHMVGASIASAETLTLFTVGALLTLVVLRLIARRAWLGDLLWLGLLAASNLSSGPNAVVRRILLGVLLLWLLNRHGVLAVAVMAIVLRLLSEPPLLLSAPNAEAVVAGHAVIVLIAAGALYAATSKPRVRKHTTG